MQRKKMHSPPKMGNVASFVVEKAKFIVTYHAFLVLYMIMETKFTWS